MREGSEKSLQSKHHAASADTDINGPEHAVYATWSHQEFASEGGFGLVKISACTDQLSACSSASGNCVWKRHH